MLRNVAILLLLLVLPFGLTQAQTSDNSTDFTYQGYLALNEMPVNGICNFNFSLFASAAGTDQVGSTVTVPGIKVTEGVFSAQLDFGMGAFNGQDRWLAVSVDCGTGMTALSPRQAITPAAYAIYANSAGNVNWGNINGLPPDFADGVDNDTLYSAGTGLTQTGTVLSVSPSYLLPQGCANNQVAKWNGTGYVCANDIDTDTNTTYSAGTGLSLNGTTFNIASSYLLPQSCSNNQVAKWNGTGYVCANDIDTDTNTTYSAGTGLSLSGTTFNIASSYLLPQGCANNQVAKWNGTGYVCANDIDTDTNTTYSAGAGLTLTGTVFSIPANSLWETDGNTGTTPGTHFIGTTDNVALDFRVNNQRVLRFEPNATSPNLIGGFSGNNVTSGVYGATINGGGQAGFSNRVTDSFGTIGGGYYNRTGNDTGTTTDANAATIGGGLSNVASGSESTVGGGYLNTASGNDSTVGGGYANTASGADSTIAGGYGNIASGSDSAVCGGINNSASGIYSTIGGGDSNQTFGSQSTIAGGYLNTTNGLYATIGGGNSNTAYGDYSNVGGGIFNTAAGNNSTVGGGYYNAANGLYNTIGGGIENSTSADKSTVGGGEHNIAGGGYSTIAGGSYNTTEGSYTTVGGGAVNRANGWYSTVSGGEWHNATGHYSTIAGGTHNTASGNYSTISGGYDNTASGASSVIPGGYYNTASGLRSFAAGSLAVADQNYSFVWSGADGNGTSSFASNSFTVRSSGGVRFYTTTTGTTTGVSLAAGGGAWSNLSDRNAKTNFEVVDSRAVLDAVTAMPVTTWNYRSQDESIRHIGPTAQDFASAFGVGENDTTINTIDADGVALAAVQGLNLKLQEEIGVKNDQILALQSQLNLMSAGVIIALSLCLLTYMKMRKRNI